MAVTLSVNGLPAMTLTAVGWERRAGGEAEALTPTARKAAAATERAAALSVWLMEACLLFCIVFSFVATLPRNTLDFCDIYV